MTNSSVIQEGALGGHMDHLYENPDLSFGEMKEIFQLASSGNLEGTQKIDGQNIFITYSLARGRALAARNKSQIKSGGLDVEGLSNFFKGRGALQKAFVDAFTAFEEAVASFSEEEIAAAFGEDGEIYYSAEVIDPGSANVIDYDEKVLNIHRGGHGRVDRETGGVSATEKDPDVQKASAVLDAAIARIQDQRQSTNFRVQRGAIQKLKAVTSGEAASLASQRLDSIVGGDGETIGEFVVSKLKPLVQQKTDLPEEKQNMLIQKMLGSKGLNKREIKKGLSEESQLAVEELLSQSKSILKSIIRPIEMVIHEFAVDVLQGMQSLFMLGSQEPKVQALRDKVTAEIAAIEGGGSEVNLARLKAQLEKMKYAEKGLKGITTAAEGFVFDYNGHTYKFTGNYAPINQILGILRYKRGGKEEVSESKIIKEEKGQGIALVPGGFKPPHAGHYDMVQWAGSQPGVDRVIVLVSPKARGSVGPQEAMQIWEIYKSLGGNFEVQLTGVNSPVGAAYEYVDNNAEPGQTIYVVKGEKDSGDKRFGSMKGRKEGVEVKELNSPSMARGMSGTQVRDQITKGDIQGFQETLPSGLSQEAKDKIWEIVSGGISLQELLIRNILEVLKEEGSPNAIRAFGKVAVAALDAEGLKQTIGQVYRASQSGRGPVAEEMEPIGEVESEKQRKWACAQLGDDFKGERKLTKKQAEEMCSSKIEEMSSMGGGSGEGGPGTAWTNFNPDENEKNKPGEKVMEYKTYSRKAMLEEALLRENIRKVLGKAVNRRNAKVLQESVKTGVIRELVRTLITEAESEISPHESTGINVLEDLLKKIVPQLEGDFKTLTTDPEQRNSFRAHILNATENTIAPKSAMYRDEESADAEPVEPQLEGELTEEDEIVAGGDEEGAQPAIDPTGGDLGPAPEAPGVDFTEEIKIEVGSDDEEAEVDAGDITALEDDEKLIDIGNTGGGEDPDDAFEALSGEDDTGRNVANMSFQKIEKSIQDAYGLLGDTKDQDLFRDYLLTNLKLYFDKFEDELGAGAIEEPTTPEYEEEKGQAAETEAPGGEEASDEGEEDLELEI